MLQRKAKSAKTLDILTRINNIPELEPFYLAGGTALALQIGHRISYDLDFFCNCKIENENILEAITVLKPFQLLSQSKNILVINIRNQKVGFVKYPYEMINSINDEGGFRFASTEDIAAMKLAAITGRGRKRDFTDIYYLLQRYSLEQMLELYSKKYPEGNRLMVLRSMTYFEDAEPDPMSKLLSEKVHWSDIKKCISEKVRNITT